MDVNEYMKTHGLSDADLDAMAAPYENGNQEACSSKVNIGSHLDAVAAERTPRKSADARHYADEAPLAISRVSDAQENNR